MTNVFEHAGVRFGYEDIGAGPVLVFCHGLGGELNQCKDLLGELASHRVIVWDAYAHGNTCPIEADERFTFERFAADLRALMDHLCIERAIVGGISMGAGVATRFAIDNPGRAHGLVLVRPAWLDAPSPPNLRLFAQIGRLLGHKQPADALAAFEDECSKKLEAIERSAPVVADSLRGQFTSCDAVERRQRLIGMPASSPIACWDEVAHLCVPAMVLGTDHDPVHPLAFAVEWADRLPASQLVQVPSKTESQTRHTSAVREHIGSFLMSLSEGGRC